MREKENSQERPFYRCLFTSEVIKIDGFLDDSDWQNAQPLNFILPVIFGKPASKTEARLLWDRNYLYVGFQAYDKDIWSYYTERDAPTCQEDVLEVFFKTEPQKEPYYNFEINARGTIYDAFNIRRQTAGSHYRWSKWNCDGVKIGIHIEGTLNNWEDEDEYWQLEMAIPFAELPSLKGKPPNPGDNWLFHLARYDYSVYLPEGVELSSCAPLTQVDFHRFEDWLTLQIIK